MRSGTHPEENQGSSAANPAIEPRARNPARERLWAALFHQRLDFLSGLFICFMVVFSPWAFGTTQSWTIWTMNICGYVLGGLLLAKVLIRLFGFHAPVRWTRESSFLSKTGVAAMGIFTLLLLAYCLTSALNARSVYLPDRMEFVYHDFIRWLPHSYDQTRSLQAFWNYLAMACFFWAVRDWLLGKTSAEIRAARLPNPEKKLASAFPARLKILLWVLSINGAVLAIESAAQRFSGTHKLLWIQETRINRAAEFQLGPYAYRSNGAQYLNLVWPATLAFWWGLQKQARRALKQGAARISRKHHLLLPAVLLMAGCPLISLSRGGALVGTGTLILAALILVMAMRRRHPLHRFGMVLFFAAAAGVGFWFGWEPLSARLKLMDEGIETREAIYETARNIPKDFPVFGTGPGTFEPVFQIYRASLDEYWPAQLHNDWLETLITFGRMGCTLIAVCFLLSIARWFVGDGIEVRWPFLALMWLALLGCLIHARYDFPMQIYSIHLLVLLICSILFSIGKRTSR